MRVFVTGGAGYVGSHSVRALNGAGHDVTVYDNLSFGHRAAVAPEAELVVGDLADSQKISAVFEAKRFDAVMHFAAFLNVGESVDQPLMYYRNNVAGTLSLLECMQKANLRRFVFSSTCAIFGVPETLPITEDLPKSPINPYGCTKYAVELMLQDCSAGWGLGATALRYFNASGAARDGSIGEDHSPETHLIPLILQVPLGQRDQIKIFGTDYPTPDGSCVRDYIHVEDLATAHVKAVEAVEPGTFSSYNVGTGNGFSVIEVIEAARKVTGHAIPAETAPRRPGDPPALYADPSKLKSELRWEPEFTDVEAILQTAWAWHRKNPSGFSE